MFLAVNFPNLLSIGYRYLISESIRQLVQHSRVYNQSERRTHFEEETYFDFEIIQLLLQLSYYC